MFADIEKVPRVVDSFDVRELTIEPTVGFLLSQIDGVLTIGDLADLVSLEAHEVQGTLEKLEELGAIAWLGASRWAPTYNSTELNEEVDLDMEHRKRVLDMYHKLSTVSHYEILGLEPEADKPAIRQSYFQLSKVFHPDTLYGKRLGTYQGKMEAVFQRLTDAYETLGKKQKREKYDAYLTHRAKVESVEKQLVRSEKKMQAMKRVMSSRPPASEKAPEVKAPSKPVQTASQKEKEARDDRVARKRKLMQQKFKGVLRTFKVPRPKSDMPPSSQPAAADDRHEVLRNLAASLKRSAMHTSDEERVRSHLAMATETEASGDLAKASASLRMAMALSPSEEHIKDEYNRVNTNLKIQLVDIHKEQALYEEDNEMWAPAAISWAKVAQGLPDDAVPLRRAAYAIFRAEGDLHKAREYAHRSLEIDPSSVSTQLVLGRIYLAAGMDKSARRHLEEAAKLDPSHEMVKNLLKQL